MPSSTGTLQLTPSSSPSAATKTPVSRPSSESESDLEVHQPGDIELQALPPSTRLLSEEDENAVAEEVLYDRSSGESVRSASRLRLRWRPPRKGEFVYSKAEERVVIRKLDIWLVGVLAGLYMLSFLDRSNIGNAAIAGIKEDLELTGSQYEWLLTAFYITYLGSEWMTLLWKVFAAHKYVAFTVICWGVTACLQALAVDWWSMMFLRGALGITEAAFGPGVPFYLSMFYKREELAVRTGMFISAAPLATAYAGFLAYAITSIPSQIAPWRLLFILEGFPSILAGIAAFYVIPDAPGEAWFLNRNQKKIARRRLLVVTDDEIDGETTIIGEAEGRGLRWAEIWVALSDPGSWITAGMLFFANVSFASIPVFLPQIIKEMGYTSTTAQALSVPPYLLAFAVILLTSYLSDRLQSRSIPLIILSTVSTIGYLLLSAGGTLSKTLSSLPASLSTASGAPSPGAHKILNAFPDSTPTAMRYTGVMLVAGTIFAIITIVIVWNGNNSRTETARGTAMAILQMVGQCGPILGVRLFPGSQGPEYVQGSLVAAACMAAVGLLVGAQRWRLRRRNWGRDKEEARKVAQGQEVTLRWREIL